MRVLRIVLGFAAAYLGHTSVAIALIGLGARVPAPAAAGLLGASGLAFGYLAGKLAAHRIAPITAALLLAVATIANLALSLGAEPLWFKWSNLMLAAPLLGFGGLRAVPEKSSEAMDADKDP